MCWYIVVKNKATKWCQLRHIIRCEPGTTIQDAMAEYYRVFHKLDGDLFFIAKSRDELETIVEREE